jgi:hypothetical protein
LRTTLMYRVNPLLLVGVESNPAADELGPLFNWVINEETADQPHISIGTSSDRIFSPAGTQAYFVTAAKSIEGTNLAPYVGLSYSEWEDRFLVPAGLNIAFDPEWDLLGMHDGRNTHALLTYKTETINYSAMLIKMKHFGISVGIGF